MPTKPKGKIDLAFAIGLPPEKAITYLKNKGYAISGDWWEVWQDAHGKAFTVAKAMQADVLEDIRVMVQKGLDKGITLNQFQKELSPKLVAKGWWGIQNVDGREVQLGSPGRLTTIYRTNMQNAFNTGRYKDQIANIEDRPYWMYVAVMDSLTRPAHGAMNGAVFKATDPFWNTHYPSNGFNCRCRVRALTEEQVKAKGLEILDSTGKLSEKTVEVAKGVNKQVTTFKGYGRTMTPDPGWSYNPGKEDFKPALKKYKAPVKAKLKTALASDGYAKRVPVNDFEDITKLLELFDKENPGMFQSGFKRFEAAKSGSFAGQTDGRGVIKLRDKYFDMGGELSNYNPAESLKIALNKIDKGEALTFGEERSIKTLWHEILHNKAKGASGLLPMTKTERAHMEALNDFVARHTYPTFLRSLGGYEAHGEKVLLNGGGYNLIVDNLREILRVTKIDEMKALEPLAEVSYDSSWKRISTDMASVLSNMHGKIDQKTFERILSLIPSAMTKSIEGYIKQIAGPLI